MDSVSAVILAAGKGTRMSPLTQTKPKPLQEVLGKNLIEWKLEALPPEIIEVVLVIGYQGDQIRAYFKNSWKGLRVRYAIQEGLNGTAGALFAARDLLGERFLVMMGDDLYGEEDVASMLKHDWAVCVEKVKNREMGGRMITNSNGNFVGIDEPKQFVKDGLVNTGMYMLRREVFNYDPVSVGGSSTEFGLPHTLAIVAKDAPVAMVIAKKWTQITTPEDLVRAESEFFM